MCFPRFAGYGMGRALCFPKLAGYGKELKLCFATGADGQKKSPPNVLTGATCGG